MFIDKNDEAKRTKAWNYVMSISSVLIVIIAVYFLTKMFAGNPLEGVWENEDNGLVMSVNGNNTVTLDLSEAMEASDLKVDLSCEIDKEEKILTIHSNGNAITEALEKTDGEFSEEMIENVLGNLVTTFDYNIEQDTLTLSEREYGEQLVFIKK